ncbi:MAG: DEAD/DEAH box helicase [Thermoplasmatales archaeon]|nr:DEAD/DEAH box helicase [Thermoplasmatales archaeon]
MITDELDLPPEALEALKQQGFSELYPPQAEAVPKALSGKNLVVSIPTASGKSFIGYAAALKTVLERRRKVLYIVPLKALASEKRDDLDRFADLGIRTVMSTGDLDSEDRRIQDADIVVATSEKADSLMRHRSTWMDEVGLVIADEIHLIHDPGRGPTLEVALTKMMRKSGDLQIIALSATISNAVDLAMWLDADLVTSDWRPTLLKEGVFLDKRIMFDGHDSVDIDEGKEPLWMIIADTVKGGGQCIVFVNSRRSTESLADKHSKSMRELSPNPLSDKDVKLLEGDADSTSLGRKLASCVKSGVAFHNAGLTYSQRRYVEEAFRKGEIKCIFATPTLAAGINLPARRVIVRDTGRFEANSGYSPIPVMEIKQMCGRAGRPGYDPYGESVLMAKNEDDARHLMNDYVRCDSESIMSKLGNEIVLRSHILGLIATGDVGSEEDIVGFIGDTFYGSESSMLGVESAVENVVDFLASEGMVQKTGEDGVTILPFGKRVSDLYIDPKSAVILRDAVMRMKPDTEDLMILHAITSTPDVMTLYPRKKDMDALLDLEEKYTGRFLCDVDGEDDYSRELLLAALKTAVLLENWMNEVDEDTITDSMGIGPGDIRSRVDKAEWIMYAMTEIARLFNPSAEKRMRPMMTRLKYGVRQELIELVSLRGVGRVRARSLFNAGIRNMADLMYIDVGKLAAIPKIGPALAKSLKEHAGAAPREIPAIVETPAPAEVKQSRLSEF